MWAAVNGSALSLRMPESTMMAPGPSRSGASQGLIRAIMTLSCLLHRATDPDGDALKDCCYGSGRHRSSLARNTCEAHPATA